MTALARFAALADDPVALVQQCEAYRLCFNAALEALHEATVENARLQRQLEELRAERRRIAADAFGWTPAQEMGETEPG